MAKVTSFGFTNKDVNTNIKINPIKLDPKSNYSPIEGVNETSLDNKTAPLDQPELLTIRSRNIPTVNSLLSNYYPAPVGNGVQYTIELDELLSTRDDSINYRVDEPIVAYLTIRHPKSSNITSTHIKEVVERLIGACYYADGSSRFDDFMRLATEPNED